MGASAVPTTRPPLSCPVHGSKARPTQRRKAQLFMLVQASRGYRPCLHLRACRCAPAATKCRLRASAASLPLPMHGAGLIMLPCQWLLLLLPRLCLLGRARVGGMWPLRLRLRACLRLGLSQGSVQAAHAGVPLAAVELIVCTAAGAGAGHAAVAKLDVSWGIAAGTSAFISMRCTAAAGQGKSAC